MSVKCLYSFPYVIKISSIAFRKNNTYDYILSSICVLQAITVQIFLGKNEWVLTVHIFNLGGNDRVHLMKITQLLMQPFYDREKSLDEILRCSLNNIINNICNADTTYTTSS